MAYPVSEKWERFFRRGFHPITRIDVIHPDDGVVYSDLPVSSGHISVSRGSAVRASGSVVIPDPALAPTVYTDSPISPLGVELVIWTGTLFPEGFSDASLSRQELVDRGFAEFVPLGRFVADDSSTSERSGNATTLHFYDRAKLLTEKSYVAPVDFGGESALTALAEVITDPDPQGPGQTWTVDVSPDVNDIILPSGTIFEQNRWAFISNVAEALGVDVYFGRDGNAYVVPIPGVTDSTTTADWVVDAGENGVLVDVRRQVRRPEANGVVVVGSTDGDSPPPYAFVTDDNPNSRTRYGGPVGKIVKRYDISELTTVEQCEAAAAAKLRETTGLQRSLSYDTFANPAADVGDVISVESLLGPPEVHMLDSYRYDFASAAMPCETRSVQYVNTSL